MLTKQLLDDIPIPPMPDCGEIVEQIIRIKCLIYSLECANTPNNPEETLNLINETLVRVENCHSGIEINNVPGLKFDGRMYPIQDDFIDRRVNGSIVAMTKGNKIIIEPNGAFSIMIRSNEEILLKKQHD